MAVAAGHLLAPPAMTGQTLADVRAEARHRPTVVEVQRAVRLEIVDRTGVQGARIPLDPGLLAAAIRSRLDGPQEEGGGVPPLSLTLRLDYFGLYRTDSGTWIGRALGDIQLRDPLRVVEESHVPLSSEVVLDKRHPAGERLVAAGERLAEATALPAIATASQFQVRTAAGLRRVTALGHAPSRELTPAAIAAAARNGVAEAVALAWGVDLDAVTTVVDLADVTTTTVERGRGRVLSTSAANHLARLTSDGYVVVPVEVVVAPPRS